MCLRLILCTVLLVSVTIILSSSSSEHRLRRRSHSWKACEPFKLPSNAEWIRRWYNRRCKGLFVCCEGYELVVKTVCNKRGRWKVKTFCVPKSNTKTPSTPLTTPSTTSSTATPTTASTTSSTTPSTSSTTPSTSATTSDPVIQCNANPMVENGIITSEISTEVGSVVQFNCSSGFTANGRVGSLTCNVNGDFEQDLVCIDCRMDDTEISFGIFTNDEVQTDSATQCEMECNANSDCVMSEFTAPTTCRFDFVILQSPIFPGDVETCRQACFNNERCQAFTLPTADSQIGLSMCTLYTRPFSSFGDVGIVDQIFSSCI